MRRRGPRLLLLALLVLPMLAALEATAAEPEATAAEPEASGEPDQPKAVDLRLLDGERQTVAFLNPVRPRVSRYLDAAYKEFEEERPEEAVRLLNRILESRLNILERAYVYRLLGFVSYGADQPKQAIEYFEKTLEQEALPVKDEARLRLNIVQLNAQLQNWSEVVASVKRWLPYTEKPEPVAFYLESIAHFQLGDLDAAIASILRALGDSQQPKESWLRLLAAMYSQKEDYEKATPVLEELVLRFPKKDYWVQLSLIYGVREDYKTSLAVQQVAYAQGFLTEDVELRRLARSYLYNDLPYPAAKVLDKGLEEGKIEPDAEAYELLANSWIAAREYDRSLPPLRKAAELSESGDLYVRLGQVHMQREQWAQATQMLEKALEKEDLDKRGNVELLLGIAHYNNQQISSARRYFVKAREYEATREQAERWISHIANESGSEAG